jgi:DNA invertase Pin-like site-specific DNA recombinase
MGLKAAIYARVSTRDQTTENQLISLREVAARSNWSVCREFIDHGISGMKPPSQRPALKNMLLSINRREFDIVMAWDVSRIGRSLQELVGILQIIHGKQIDLFLYQQGIDTSTPVGKMMFQMCGVFAEFEREILRERVMSGLSRAKSQGKKLGRPSNISPGTRSAVNHLRNDLNWGVQRIAKELRIGVETVYTFLRPSPEG